MKVMDEMTEFLNNILKELNINKVNNITIDQERNSVRYLNDFLYINYEGIGKTFELNEDREYISDYHKFWKENCEQILRPKLNLKKCEEVAEVFHNIYLKNRNAFYSLYSKEGLNDEDVCKIRFYTASQDFNGSRNFSEYASMFKRNPDIFNKEKIYQDPKRFIKANGPKSISILGRTGWSSAYVRKNQGGGGLMA